MDVEEGERMSGYILEGERGRWMMYRERMSGYVSERNKGGVGCCIGREREGVQRK